MLLGSGSAPSVVRDPSLPGAPVTRVEIGCEFAEDLAASLMITSRSARYGVPRLR